MGSRRLCCPTGAHRGTRNLLRVARTRAASGAAGEELGSGKRCSRQPAHPRSPRSTEHPSGAPLSPGHSKLCTGRRHKGTEGAKGAGAGSAEDAGSGGPSARRWRPSRAGPHPSPGSCACAPTSASLGPARSALLEEDSSLVLGVRGALPVPPHLLLVQIGRRGKSREGIGCRHCHFCSGPYLYRARRRGNAVNLEEGGSSPLSPFEDGDLEARPAPACLEQQATTPPFPAGVRLRPVGPPPSAKLLVKFRVAGRPCPGGSAAVPSATLAPSDSDRPRPRAGRPRGPPPPGPGR